MGVWRSTDQGVSWTQCGGSSVLNALSVADLAVAPNYDSTTGRVFAITTDGRIYRSTDGGASFAFRLAVASGIGTSIAVSPSYSSDSTIWAGFDGKGLYYSTNGGTNWTQDTYSSTVFPKIYDLAPSPNYSSDTLLYVGGYSQDIGPVATRSLGGTWLARRSGLGTGSTDTVLSLTALRSGTQNKLWAGTLQGGMYKTVDGGANWSAGCDVSFVVTVPSIWALAVSHNSAPLLLEGRTDRLFQSTDGGTNCTGITPMGRIQALAFEPLWDGSTYCHIFIGTEDGLFRKGCATSPGMTGLSAPDAKSVALAGGMHGAFVGSGSQGLFKSQARNPGLTDSSKAMVRYNNFPNKLTPDVVAICLDPLYDETSTSCGDASTLFVAVNFSSSATDSGVYKSTDYGNTWTKLTGGAWPASGVTLYDLAISPQYREGSSDTTLYAATSDGLLRWDGGTICWVQCQRDAVTLHATYKIGIPPTFSRAGTGTWDHTLFMADVGGVYYSTGLGTTGTWSSTGYTDAVCSSSTTVSGFAFAHNFGQSGGSFRMFISNSRGACGYVHTSNTSGWSAWSAVNDGLPSAQVGATGLAAEPDFDEATTQKRLILATPNGPYYGTFTASTGTANWQLVPDSFPALAVTFSLGGSGTSALVGYARKGAALSLTTGGSSYPAALSGYNSLPDDVFQTLPNVRDPNILFASSPTMGVFVSQNKGLSFRPFNRGGEQGPCALRDAFGLGMVQDRQGSGLDVIWTGTNGTGIKYRVMSYNSGTGVYNLDSSWWKNTSATTGRFERFATLGTGQTNRVYAASPDSVAGIYYACPGCWITWTNADAPGPAHSVKFGYEPLVSITPLASGVPTGSQSVDNDHWNYYSIVVPAGMGSLQVTMTPSAGDPDLYVRRGDLPNLSLWDYRPYLGGLSVEMVTVNFPTPGIYYLGVRGWATGTSTYTLVATRSSNPLAPALERMAATPASKPELNPFESAPGQKAPGGGIIWGTINGAVVLDDGSGWVVRNGQAPYQLTNPDTQTVLQLKDGTLVLGCNGDAFYSPQPDEGLTTWISSTDNFAGACSYDFRDLYQVDLDPAAPSDMRADCLMAAYGTGASTSGGVWLSGDKGHHWMKISSGFDPDSQKLNSIVSDSGELGAPDGTTAYYSSTDGTGVYTRTITLQAYPTVSSVSPSTGNVAGGGTVTVTGVGFSNACPTGSAGDCPNSNPVILFGTTEAATSWTDTTHLSATVPPHALGGVTVTVRNPDTRQAVTGPTYTYNACSSPTGAGPITATDLDPFLKSGVQVTWPQDCTWNDGDPTGRLYRVLRGGVDISGALAYGTTTYTDLTGTAGVSYSYSVRYTSGCALSVTSGTQSAADQYLVPPEAAATPAAALRWTSGLKTQMTWGATTGATGYKLYKGADTEISKLPAPGASVCIGYQGAGVVVDTRLGTTATLTSNPSSGHFYWYILAATNGAGDGPLAVGQVVSSTGACASP